MTPAEIVARLAGHVTALNPYPFHASMSLRTIQQVRCVGDECGVVNTANDRCPICGGSTRPESNYRLAPWARPS